MTPLDAPSSIADDPVPDADPLEWGRRQAPPRIAASHQR